jgi:beta-glucosidase
MPSSPLHALRAHLPGARVSYDSGEDLPAAAAAAKSADVAIVFAYQWESEGFDLRTLALAPEQERLIETVSAANPHTVVVLETGGPVTMPWIDKVGAVIETWYPGIRGGAAIARILTGEVSPTGRLPISFPKRDASPHARHPAARFGYRFDLCIGRRPIGPDEVSRQRPAALPDPLRREARGRLQMVRRGA